MPPQIQDRSFRAHPRFVSLVVPVAKAERRSANLMKRSLAHLLIALSATNALYLAEFHFVYSALSPAASYFRTQAFYSLMAASYYGSLLAVVVLFGFLGLEFMVRRGWLSEQGVFRLAGACIVFGLSTAIPGLIARISSFDIRTLRESSSGVVVGGLPL
jgi:hypothetical protein